MKLTQEALEKHRFLFTKFLPNRAAVVRLKAPGCIEVDLWGLDGGTWVGYGVLFWRPDLTDVETVMRFRPSFKDADFEPITPLCHECSEPIMDTPVRVGKRMFCKACGVTYSDPCPECGTQNISWAHDHVGGTIDCTVGIVDCHKCGHEWFAYRDLRPENKHLLTAG